MAGILLIQLMPATGKKDVNLRKVDYFLDKNKDKKLDLIVLPEFFSTGIDHKSFKGAPEDENGGSTIEKISGLAKIYRTNIAAGTVIEKSGGKYYNTMFVINRDGEIVCKYRKIHLYNYFGGSEGEIVTSGNEIKTIDLDFGKIGLAVCFDIRYPMQFQKLARDGADIIVVSSAWCIPNEVYENIQSRKYAQDMWIAMNRIRAYDNQVYIISCNQTKRSNNRVSCIGNSLVVSPAAEILANAKDEQCAVYAEIDIQGGKYYKSLCPLAGTD